MITIQADNASQLYTQALTAILVHGQEIAPRERKTRELLGATLYLTDASRNIVLNPFRKLNYRFMAAEFCWIASGSALVEQIVPYNSKLAAFSDNGITFLGAYGPMWIEQMPFVLDTLTRDPASRQAVVSIWRPRPGASKDIPCTVSWQFLIRDGSVHMVTTMRSNDAWLGLPYDLYTFTMLQRLVATILGLPVGTYTHHVGSLHLYEEDWDKVDVADETVNPVGVAQWAGAPTPGTLQMLLVNGHQIPTEHRATACGNLSAVLPKFWSDLVSLLLKHPGEADDEQVAMILRRWSLALEA